MDEKIKIVLGEMQKLKIEVNDKDLLQSIKADAYAIYLAYNEMFLWFADPNTPESQKAEFAEQKINLMRSAADLTRLLEMMGYDQKQIDEILVLPF